MKPEGGSRSKALGIMHSRCRPVHYPARTICTAIFLAERGPSNSQKNTPCHVPRFSLPPVMMIATDGPTRLVFTCPGLFPSACL